MLLLLLSFPVTHAQDNYWQVILHSGDTLKACRLDSLQSEILSATCSSGAYSFPVDSIVAFARPKERHFWKGAKTGALIGGAVGVIVGIAVAPKETGASGSNLVYGNFGAGLAVLGGGLAGALGGLVVGGVIEASSSNTETYDLKEKTTGFKLAIIKRLLSERNNRTR